MLKIKFRFEAADNWKKKFHYRIPANVKEDNKTCKHPFLLSPNPVG